MLLKPSYGKSRYNVMAIALLGLSLLLFGCGEDEPAAVGPELDTVAPTVPTNFQANKVAGVKVILSWSPSTDNVGVTGYRVSRDDQSYASVSDTTFTDSSPSAWETHTYAVLAYDSSGNESIPSQQVQVTITLDAGDIQGQWTGTFRLTNPELPMAGKSTLTIAADGSIVGTVINAKMPVASVYNPPGYNVGEYDAQVSGNWSGRNTVLLIGQGDHVYYYGSRMDSGKIYVDFHSAHASTATYELYGKGYNDVSLLDITVSGTCELEKF